MFGPVNPQINSRKAFLKSLLTGDDAKYGLPVDVLRNAKNIDYTNGGVSSKFNTFILVDPQIDEIFGSNLERPALKIVRRVTYIHAEPLTPVPAGCVGYMFGGNFVTSSDSRISGINQYPIPVHDRIETSDEYARLSV